MVGGFVVVFGAEVGLAPSAVYTGIAHCWAMTTFPLPSTPSGAATPEKTGVVATIRGIRNPEVSLTHESRVSFVVGVAVPIPT